MSTYAPQSEKYKWICVTLIIIVGIVGFYGFMWLMPMSDAKFTIEFAMDERTANILTEHDYCLYINDAPHESNKNDISFLGDCEYLQKAGIMNISREFS